MNSTDQNPTRKPVQVGPLGRWLMAGHVSETEGPHTPEHKHKTHPWWQVMCLTGVDYFSTLGYQPGIAAIAAGALSPVATLILVLLTLFGALPMYRRVAEASPHGDGSISMLSTLLSWWEGKLFVLCLIGFVATGFVITITLSAADATAHLLENPYAPHWLEGHAVGVTIFLIALLGVVFLKGFNEAIGIAVGVVGIYIGLNLVVLGRAGIELMHHPEDFTTWRTSLVGTYSNPFHMLIEAVKVFPALALGLSGFETGVVVMPLVKGDPGDTDANPRGRIRNTHKLLTTAALMMSVLLIASSFMTTLLIPHSEFETGGQANGRALAYLAHKLMGDGFGTVYDIATILILWFAGASAMAGLLNIVPRYLPRYGMAPEWTRANRPLVLIFTAICFLVTVLFKADVEAQAGAYATGVLALMTSATVAVTLAAHKARQRAALVGFSIITLIFIYTTIVTVIKHPEGLRIALIFIGAIVLLSLISRVWRSLELRVESFEVDDVARRFMEEVAADSEELRLIPNRPETCDVIEYDAEERDAREDHEIPDTEPVMFIEVYVRDASEFSGTARIYGVEVGRHRILRVEGTAIPNALAATLLYLRDQTGKRPHAYFNWTEGNPILYMIRYVLSGEGETAPVTREILRQAEPDPRRRPGIHAAM